jgi:hypothetical protein
MIDCPRRDKWWRPCRFEPRYDLSAAVFPPNVDSLRVSTHALEAFRDSTYAGDVCITCGKTVHPMEQPQ